MEFEEYVAARGASLVRFAYVLTLDAHLAEDLTQSALAEVYRHWKRVSGADHPDAYVRRAVVNTYLTWRRRRSSGEMPTGDPGGAGATVQDPADRIADRDEAKALLGSLPPRARTVLVLRYYADMDDTAAGGPRGGGGDSGRRPRRGRLVVARGPARFGTSRGGGRRRP